MSRRIRAWLRSGVTLRALRQVVRRVYEHQDEIIKILEATSPLRGQALREALNVDSVRQFAGVPEEEIAEDEQEPSERMADALEKIADALEYPVREVNIGPG